MRACGGAEIVFLHRDALAFGPEQWALVHRISVTGGLALVRHDEGDVVEPGAGWTTVRAGRRATLLQTPNSFADVPQTIELSGPRWVMGESDSWASEWASLLDSPEVSPISHEALVNRDFESLDAWSQVADVRAIDFFCGRDSQGPTGEKAAARFIGFVQALVLYRIEGASHRCRLTVVTQGAAFEVEDPRGSALWGAVRSMTIKVDDEAAIDFRLVDLDAPDDLQTLAMLAGCDLRERELAVRDNRLWASRMVGIRERYPRVPAGAEPAYRLTLENPGQVTGLEMKTYDPGAPGPHGVEIEVAVDALNFRDWYDDLMAATATAGEGVDVVLNSLAAGTSSCACAHCARAAGTARSARSTSTPTTPSAFACCARTCASRPSTWTA